MSAELDVTFLGWTKTHRAREHPCGSTPTVPETVKSKRGGFSVSRHFSFPTPCLSGCSCCWFINLFRVVSSFDVRCYFLLLWCWWQDVKEFVHFPLGLVLGKGLSMLFVVHVGITVHDPHMHTVLKLSGHVMLCDWCDCLKMCKIPSSNTTFKGTPKIVVKQHWTSSSLHRNVFDLI